MSDGFEPDWERDFEIDHGLGISGGPGLEARREAQRRENAEIGEGSNTIPSAQILSLDQMLAEYVFIRDGSQVASSERPQSALALADFRNAMAGSKHAVESEPGKVKMVSTVKLWLESRQRLEAEALTFRAGAPAMTIEPSAGRAALNLWRPMSRTDVPADWSERSRPFVEHVTWLWGADANAFLDWLAHIEQRPGILPHYGWVHISREHGKGRNWISSVLTRVWTGYVAASLDLIPILDGGFNGRISRKLLAIVDEINEGGNASYKHAQKLRQIVTEEHRDINPKYGRQRVEYNSCRWLMFSNHTGALPLTEDDRRFWIVAHDGAAKDGAYYSGLYGRLCDPSFIASVAEFLRRRPIDNFRPGARPPMTRAKAELIAFSQTEDDTALKAFVDKWPVDLITGFEIAGHVGEGGASKPAVRHAMDRVGIRKLPSKVRLFEQGVQNVYAVRNFEKWGSAAPDKIKAEHIRESDDVKRRSLDLDDA